MMNRRELLKSLVATAVGSVVGSRVLAESKPIHPVDALKDFVPLSEEREKTLRTYCDQKVETGYSWSGSSYAMVGDNPVAIIYDLILRVAEYKRIDHESFKEVIHGFKEIMNTPFILNDNKPDTIWNAIHCIAYNHKLTVYADRVSKQQWTILDWRA